jgi:hypothetical protein
MPKQPIPERKNALVIVIRTPIAMRAFTRILRACALADPRSVVDTNPHVKTVTVDGWLVKIGGDDDVIE